MTTTVPLLSRANVRLSISHDNLNGTNAKALTKAIGREVMENPNIVPQPVENPPKVTLNGRAAFLTFLCLHLPGYQDLHVDQLQRELSKRLQERHA